MENWPVVAGVILSLCITGAVIAAVWVPHSSASHKKGSKISFGDTCTNTSSLPDGLCCCSASGLAAYGAQAGTQWCSNSLACTGSHDGFCGKIPNDEVGGYPVWAQATRDFCQFDCPCCASEDYDILSLAQGNTQRITPDKHTGAHLAEKWAQDPLELFDIANDTFHRDLMADVKATYTLAEFYNKTYSDPSWASLVEMQTAKQWTDGELAMYLYTTEYPEIYRRLNQMLRTATSMSQISPYWQSYMAIFRQGLQTKASYAKVDVWRGTACDAAEGLPVGTWGVFPSFTSTSSNKNIAYNFGCVVLEITGGGYDISSYSAFPGESELIIEPGRLYKVSREFNDTFDKSTISLATSGPNSMKLPPKVETGETYKPMVCGKFDRSTCDVCTCCQKPPFDRASLAEAGHIKGKQALNLRRSASGQQALTPGV